MDFIFQTHNKKVDNFMNFAFNHLAGAGIHIVMSPSNYIYYKDTGKINGCFDEENATLSFSVGHELKEWLSLFVHEYCHFCQWFDNADVWQHEDTFEELNSWIEHKIELSPERVNEIITPTQLLEWDCEKRVLECIKDWSLPIPTREYTRKARAYVIFYEYIKKHRKWYKIGNEPYRTEEVLKLMSTNIEKDLKMTKRMELAFGECV